MCFSERSRRMALRWWTSSHVLSSTTKQSNYCLKLFLKQLSSVNPKRDLPTDPKTDLVFSHRPVMSREILRALRPEDGHVFLDMTFGSGGHTKHLLSTNKKIKVYALDRDPIAYQKAVVLSESKLIADSGQKVVPLLGRFSELPNLMEANGVAPDSVNGVIMDLGPSSMQFDDSRRGFSLSSDGPLDMRMDGHRFESMPTAADVVNTLNAEQLAKIFKIYGEEKYALKISQSIVDSRFLMKRLSSTQELANLIANISSNRQSLDSLGRSQHPSTKVFQALRIFVNNEINELNYGLEKVRQYLKQTKNQKIINLNESSIDDYIEDIDGGIIAVLSFHSLEDKIVKKHFTGIESNQKYKTKDFSCLEVPEEQDINRVVAKKWKVINKKVITPSEEEVLENPRSRSAKLRLAVKIE